MHPGFTLEVHLLDRFQEIPLTGVPVTLGRAADNPVVLDGPQVSRYHARLEWVDGAPHLVDTGSANGTRLNGVELEKDIPYPLKDQDTFQIGDFRLVVRQALAGDEPATLIDARPAATAVKIPVPAGPSTVELTDRPDHPGVPTEVQPAGHPPAARPAATLTITTPGGVQTYRLEQDELVIGRDPACEIVIAESVVSRRHARLQRTADGYLIEDLDSSNGLSVDGEAVKKRLLKTGEVISITGLVTLVYTPAPSAPIEAAARTAVQPAVLPAGAAVPGPVQKIDMRTQHSLTVGRSPDNTLKLDHPTISRHHARIQRIEGRGEFIIEDLNSGNGTTVNGKTIPAGRPFPLNPGDSIRIGPVRLVFAPEGVQAVDESRNLSLDALHLNQFVGKGVNLLQDISLSIYPREFIAVVGVSGAGKSTLLNALTGFRPANAGSVLVNGTDLYRNFDSYRTDLGYVPQDDIIHKELTPRKALDYAARLRLPADITKEERRQAVDDELKALGLLERKDVPISSLSGGQRKRVSIGVERLTRPGLFFLDEATSGLDPGTETQLMRLLRGLADQGQTVLLITHATKNVTMCDQVVFLARGGHLAYFGPPAQALAYFGVQDFDQIYEKLTGELSPAEWAERYRKSPQYQEYVVGRLQSKYGALLDTHSGVKAPAARPAGRAATRPKRASGLRQFFVLVARYLDIIRSDRMNLLLLFLIAPILGSMDLIAWPRDVYDPVNGDAARAMVMLFLGAIIPFLVGALSSVREIVKERAIYQRERTVTLKIIPYLASKVFVGLLFALYHAAALLAIKLLAVDFSHLGAEAILKLYAVLVMAVVSGVLWGLLISTLAPREEQAMLLVIVVVVVQMVFSGGILPLDQLGKVGEFLGAATSSKWTFQAMTDVTEVMRGDCGEGSLQNCELPGIQSYASDPERRVLLDHLRDRYGNVLDAEFETSVAAMGAIMVVLFVLLAVLQKRKDVI